MNLSQIDPSYSNVPPPLKDESLSSSVPVTEKVKEQGEKILTGQKVGNENPSPRIGDRGITDKSQVGGSSTVNASILQRIKNIFKSLSSYTQCVKGMFHCFSFESSFIDTSVEVRAPTSESNRANKDSKIGGLLNELKTLEENFTRNAKAAVNHRQSLLKIAEFSKDTELFDIVIKGLHAVAHYENNLRLFRNQYSSDNVLESAVNMARYISNGPYFEEYAKKTEAVVKLLGKELTEKRKYPDPVLNNHNMAIFMQHLPRYKLLFTEIIKNFPQTHPGIADLKQALEKIEEVNLRINNALPPQDLSPLSA